MTAEYSEEELLTTSHDLLRRMPPSLLLNSLSGLLTLQPNLTDSLLSTVDQPLQVRTDPITNNQYILCDYNRDGDSYRSPWSNKYDPTLDYDALYPNDTLRNMEIEANTIFDIYKKQYFDTGVSSVYCFDIEQQDDKNTNNNNTLSHFGCIWLIHKPMNENKQIDLHNATWDSIHVFDILKNDDYINTYTYTLTTTVMIYMKLDSNNTIGDVDLSGQLTFQISKSIILEDDNTHIVNMGTMIEDGELKARNSIEGICMQHSDCTHKLSSVSYNILTHCILYCCCAIIYIYRHSKDQRYYIWYTRYTSN